MVLHLRLLGVPTASIDGVEVRLRGSKGWALLAYLLRADRPVARERLAGMLFADAADPQGALRWNLSQLRRLLRVELDGDPLGCRLPAGTELDLDVLTGGAAEDAVTLPGLDDGLLAGVHPAGSEAFQLWLDAERRHVAKLASDVRREAALGCLGRGEAERAIALAQQVVGHDPLDERAAVLLVRCLHSASRHDDARSVVSETARRMREELGVDPSDRLWKALAPSPGGDRLATGPIAVIAQLEAGEAALQAGAVEAGVAALRSAVVAGRAVGNPRLLARSLTALGKALVETVRGVDEDGVALLHESIPLAEAAGDQELVSLARRVLGYVDFLHGRYERSWAWLARAREITEDELAHGWIDVYAGAGRDDVGDAAHAREHLEAAVDTGRRLANVRLEAYALTMLGRHQLHTSTLAEAADTLTEARRLARGCDWTSLIPFPESMLADTVRRTGDLPRARRLAEHATVLAQQVSDPCYQATSLRTLGLVQVDQGEFDSGMAVLADVDALCRGYSDTYRWITAWSVDALADVTTSRGLPDGRRWTQQLEDIAAPCGMQPFLDRARVYRERGAARTTQPSPA